MEVIRKEVGELEAVITVKINREDIMPAIMSKLKEMKSKSNMPGFRQGNVPISIFIKRYGVGVLREIAYQTALDKYENYIEENDIVVAINSSVDTENLSKQKFDFSECEVSFGIGYVEPQDFVMPEDNKVTRFVVNITDDDINEQVDILALQHANYTDFDTVVDEDFYVNINITQLDSDNEIVRDGHETNSTIQPKEIDDEDIKKMFMNKKIGEMFICDMRKAFPDSELRARKLSITNHDSANLSNPNFLVKILRIKQKEKANVDSDLFGKVFNKDTVETEEEFRNKIRERLTDYYNTLSNALYTEACLTKLRKYFHNIMPKNVIYRTLLGKENDNTEKAQESCDNFIKENVVGMMIEAYAAKNKVELNDDEIDLYATKLTLQKFHFLGSIYIYKKDIEIYAKSLMSEEKERKRMLSEAWRTKVIEKLVAQVTSNDKEISMKDFDAILKETEGKDEIEIDDNNDVENNNTNDVENGVTSENTNDETNEN